MKSSPKSKKEENPQAEKAKKDWSTWECCTTSEQAEVSKTVYLALLWARRHAHQEFTTVHMIGSNLLSYNNSCMEFCLSTLPCMIQHTA